MSSVKFIKTILNRLPYIKTLHQQSLNCVHPNGHFYSPVISLPDIKLRQNEIWKHHEVDGIAGINLNTAEQKKLISGFSDFYKEMPFKGSENPVTRYRFDNDYYSYTDAILLYCVTRHFKPTKIIEIGSGFSSAVLLDTNEHFFNGKINVTFIEPYPERLLSLMTEADKKSVNIIEDKVQSVSLDIFKELKAGDILFVDSTHVSKTGSDVNHILFEIMPVLNTGVIIHFHDIFYPFEYPKEWVLRGYNWNEDYILRAFLTHNDAYEIKLFPDYLHRHHQEVFSELPLTYKNTGGSFWLEKK